MLCGERVGRTRKEKRWRALAVPLTHTHTRATPQTLTASTPASATARCPGTRAKPSTRGRAPRRAARAGGRAGPPLVGVGWTEAQGGGGAGGRGDASPSLSRGRGRRSNRSKSRRGEVWTWFSTRRVFVLCRPLPRARIDTLSASGACVPLSPCSCNCFIDSHSVVCRSTMKQTPHEKKPPPPLSTHMKNRNTHHARVCTRTPHTPSQSTFTRGAPPLHPAAACARPPVPPHSTTTTRWPPPTGR